ncbi:hypothetical protein AAEX28_01415 [Lentisphaerota bacterium WC36G]|nr:hypothetical protein LJT99_04300 [Lentisphaerae bacterium WC36]
MFKKVYFCAIFAMVLSGCSFLNFNSLENDSFKADLNKDHSIKISNKAKELSVIFKPNFVVFFAKKNPKISLRSVSGRQYSVSSWITTNPQAKNTLKENSKEVDYFSIGDGFDPSILKGSNKGRVNDIFQSAPAFWLTATSAKVIENTIHFTFKEHPLFKLSAELKLPEGDSLPKFSYQFTALKDGYYSIGYVGAPASKVAEISEIWQPLIWQEKRFPKKSYLTLAYRCPVPSTFVTKNTTTVGVVADPKEYPFEPLPTRSNSRFGVAVRDVKGLARPMIFSPVLGNINSKMTKNKNYQFSMRLYVNDSDTMKAQEVVARKLFNFKEYRNNAVGSLNKTVDNIADYIMSKYSLFEEEYKGCNYSTDAPGAVKNVSSIDPLDLSIVLDNKEMFERRAYPYMEYMLSRGKFLFTVNEKQRNQYPSYRLDGPAAPVSELCALYNMFGHANPLFKKLAKEEFKRNKVRNLNAVDKGDTWWNALSIYSATKDKKYLDFAVAEADKYLAKRLNVAQTTFNDPDALGGDFFWNGYLPRYMDLLMLYEATKEKRFLKAAHIGARRYAQFVWLSPLIPNIDLIVNKDGKAPMYWYLKGKGHKQVYVPEETVPAWRLSAIGLTAESSGTSPGHRGIFMANHAPWMMKIGYLTNDQFLIDIARNAVIGRYRNFPGYHINTTRTTAYEKEDFPLRKHKEQSVSSFHYNHILPMLSMLIDYLVNDAYVRSEGKINFPYNYSEGYAYMQNKAYGAMTGNFYNYNDALLWMPKNLITVPDQVNYISARGKNNLYIALMNQFEKPIKTQIKLNKKIITQLKNKNYKVEIISKNGVKNGILQNGVITIDIAPKGLTSLVIKNLKVMPKFQDKIATSTAKNSWKCDYTELTPIKGKAMVFNLGKDLLRGYVYLEYSKKDFTKVELKYQSKDGIKTLSKTKFPFEITVPLDKDAHNFEFELNCYKTDGSVIKVSAEQKLQR